jgi:hypothetical protein
VRRYWCGFSGVAAGAARDGLDVTLDTGTAGAFSQQITLFGTGYNASGYSGTLTPEVVTVTGTVSAVASPVLNTANPVTPPNQRLDATPLTKALSFTNAATAPAQTLDVSVASTTGAATGTGAINMLAAGQTDDTSIKVGVNTGTVGSQSGTVVLNEDTDGTVVDNSGTLLIGTQTVTVSSDVFEEAAPSVGSPAAFMTTVSPATLRKRAGVVRACQKPQTVTVRV